MFATLVDEWCDHCSRTRFWFRKFCMISNIDELVRFDLLCLSEYDVHDERIKFISKKMQNVFLFQQRLQNFNISLHVDQERQKSFFWIRAHSQIDEQIWRWFDVEYNSIHFRHEAKLIEFIIEHFIKFRNFRTINFSIQSHDICKTHQNRYERNRSQSNRKKRILRQTKNHKRKKNRKQFIFTQNVDVIVQVLMHRIIKFHNRSNSIKRQHRTRSRVSILKNEFVWFCFCDRCHVRNCFVSNSFHFQFRLEFVSIHEIVVVVVHQIFDVNLEDESDDTDDEMKNDKNRFRKTCSRREILKWFFKIRRLNRSRRREFRVWKREWRRRWKWICEKLNDQSENVESMNKKSITKMNENRQQSKWNARAIYSSSSFFRFRLSFVWHAEWMNERRIFSFFLSNFDVFWELVYWFMFDRAICFALFRIVNEMKHVKRERFIWKCVRLKFFKTMTTKRRRVFSASNAKICVSR